MKVEKLPTKLTAEPLIDALCEMRFSAAVAASNILPGLLYKELGGGANVRLETLPASQIPPELRQADPMLQATPLMRLFWEGFVIGVGDSSVTVSIYGKYPGWPKFKSAIMKVMDATIRSGIVTKIQRYSIKYIDVIEFGAGRPAGGLDLSLSIGAHKLQGEVAHIRVEVHDSPYIHIIQAITTAEAALVGGERRRGSLIDIDTISTDPDSVPDGFMKSLAENLDIIHTKNKRVFFECLTEQTLQDLGPIYE